MQSRITFAMAVLIPLLAACSAESDAPGLVVPEATVRDSAGVTIVENAPRDQMGSLPWTLGAVPMLRIGELEGDEPYQLFRVRDAHRLPDGRIVIADGGSQEIRLFAPDGGHLDSWGGQGEGPGEFTALMQVDLWRGDSLIAWDGRARRLSVFAEDGSLGRTLTLHPREGLTSFAEVHVLRGGSVIATGSSFEFDGPPNGLFRPPVSAVRLADDGETAASFGSHPGNEGYILMSENSVQVIRLLFQLTNKSTTWGDRFVISGTDAYSLPAFDQTGTLRRIVRVLGDRPVFTEADIQTEIDFVVDAAPSESQAEFRSGLEQVPPPEVFPAFSSVIDDASGNLWVQDFRRPSQAGPERWTVFDPDGRALGRFDTPEGFTVFEIGADYLLGRTKDDLDVERVVLLSLARD
jgi:hypothetical protein